LRRHVFETNGEQVEAGYQIGCPTLTFCAGFGVQFVHQIDDVEEASPPSLPDASAGNADGEVGLASAIRHGRLDQWRDDGSSPISTRLR